MADLDRRGLSTAVGYALSMGITVLLVAGLLTVAGGMTTDQRERAVRSEAEVLGQRVATDLMTADRLAQAADDGVVRVRSYLPQAMAGVQYTIHVEANASRSVVILETDNPDVRVVTPFRNETRVASTSVTGGPIVVSYSGTKLEVRADD